MTSKRYVSSRKNASRELVIVQQNFTACIQRLSQQSAPIAYLSALPQSLPYPFQAVVFSNARALLGQEFVAGILDMRAENGVHFNLEALAIIAGTIQRAGTLYIFCPNWAKLSEQIDYDSLRWNDQQVIKTPRFFQYFQKLVRDFQFQSLMVIDNALELSMPERSKEPYLLTAEQQKILDTLPTYPAQVHLITAPRGRGKSTLAGLLAQKIANTQPILITSSRKSVLVNFGELSQSYFIAPDLLLKQLAQQQISTAQWLFIDEAASLPIAQLVQLIEAFDNVILTSTTHNYEGTGRGFSLKLPQQIKRTIAFWQLHTPLRWAENDRLENFIQKLLLLENQPLADPDSLTRFYQLLADAHYKTTPSDLRRLFDAEDQWLEKRIENQQLVGGLWAIKEGGIADELSQAIWRGERRPNGNLVAQYLCYQANLPSATRLKSLRISRIAVMKARQKQGIGKQLVANAIARFQHQGDFISVSFGLTEGLYRFWQSCGFELVQISPRAEASSGCPSAIMIYPVSLEGRTFSQQAMKRWQEDLPYLDFLTLPDFLEKPPLAEQITLDSDDWQNLYGFAFAKRSFIASFASLKRLTLHTAHTLAELERIFQAPPPSKANITQARQCVALYLTTYFTE